MYSCPSFQLQISIASNFKTNIFDYTYVILYSFQNNHFCSGFNTFFSREFSHTLWERQLTCKSNLQYPQKNSENRKYDRYPFKYLSKNDRYSSVAYITMQKKNMLNIILQHKGLLYELKKCKKIRISAEKVWEFLKYRSLQIKINSTLSEKFTPQPDLPQYSALSPILYNIFCHDMYNHELD